MYKRQGRHAAGDDELTAALAPHADRVGTIVSSDLYYDPRAREHAEWAAVSSSSPAA